MGPRLRAATILATGALAGTVEVVRDTHLAISNRAFGAVGPLGAPARVLHDGIARGVYGTVRGALGAAGHAAAGMIPAEAEIEPGPRTLGALNAAFGDRLAEAGNELALPMTLRHARRDVALDAAGIRAAFPQATGKLAVFIHGLGEVESDWARSKNSGAPTYGRKLESDLGYTALFIRYNTGLHVSENGLRLADLLRAAAGLWPVAIDSIALIGHSMGGLVARSACHQAHLRGDNWVAAVRHVVSLGTPHHGAPLEKIANVAGWALAALPETRAVARLVNLRSAGIKDLRFGALTEADWAGADPDRLLHDNRQGIPFLEGAVHCYIGATLTADVKHPAGRLVGDLLVRMPSASGRGPRGRRLPFELEHGLELGGLDHFDLLNHPAVYARLREWLR